MKVPEHHLFVCVNKRSATDPRGSCLERGGTAVFHALKAERERRGLKETTRVSSSGCLGACEHGATVAIYPAGTFYGRVAEADASAIFDAIQRGGHVERLEIPVDTPPPRSAP